VHSHLNSLASDSSAGVSGRGALNLMAPMRADFDSRSVSPSPATALRVSSAAPSPLLRSGHNNVPSRTNSSDDIQLQDYARFVEHFRNIDTDADGYVSGLEARPLLTQSELPVAELRKIWDLADMTSDGRLDRHEFAVAMILIQARQKGAALPESLPAHLRSPPDIFTAGGSRKQLPADISSQSSFSSAGVPSSNVSPTANGGLAARALARDPESITSSPLVQSASVYLPATASGPMEPMHAGLTTTDSPRFEDAVEHSPTAALRADETRHLDAAAYAKFASNFAFLDSDGDGLITGGEARPVLAASGLPTGVLRQIWDLADMGVDGMLDQHEFVIAMHLIERSQRGEALPSELPREYLTPPRETISSSANQPAAVFAHLQQTAAELVGGPQVESVTQDPPEQPPPASLLPEPFVAGGICYVWRGCCIVPS